MSAIFAWPAELKWKDPGVALTFVVPASACNLSCGFCAIGQRKEAMTSALTPQDYRKFIAEVARANPTAMVAIQGYEPLLDESWGHTTAILKEARALGIPRSLVTNGIMLEKRAQELASFDPTGITVSLDSANPARHDRLRGKLGAFEQTLRGISALSALPGMAERITISSVLLPGRTEYLNGMPRLLKDLGIRQWAVSPLLEIKKGVLGGPADDSDAIITAVIKLHALAVENDVELVLDDELAMIESRQEHYQDFLIRRFDRPDGLVRLSPSGAVSIGREILSEIDEESAVWNPRENAVQFLQALRSTSSIPQLLVAA